MSESDERERLITALHQIGALATSGRRRPLSRSSVRIDATASVALREVDAVALAS